MDIFKIFSSKNREFPCPECSRPVIVLDSKEDGSTILRHPKDTGCTVNNGQLLQRYVIVCAPKMRYPNFEDTSEALWKKYEEELRRNG
jgi:hypothetical protein